MVKNIILPILTGAAAIFLAVVWATDTPKAKILEAKVTNYCLLPGNLGITINTSDQNRLRKIPHIFNAINNSPQELFRLANPESRLAKELQTYRAFKIDLLKATDTHLDYEAELKNLAVKYPVEMHDFLKSTKEKSRPSKERLLQFLSQRIADYEDILKIIEEKTKPYNCQEFFIYKCNAGIINTTKDQAIIISKEVTVNHRELSFKAFATDSVFIPAGTSQNIEFRTDNIPNELIPTSVIEYHIPKPSHKFRLISQSLISKCKFWSEQVEVLD